MGEKKEKKTPQLLELGRNNALYVAAWIVCNLLLNAQNMLEI